MNYLCYSHVNNEIKKIYYAQILLTLKDKLSYEIIKYIIKNFLGNCFDFWYDKLNYLNKVTVDGDDVKNYIFHPFRYYKKGGIGHYVYKNGHHVLNHCDGFEIPRVYKISEDKNITTYRFKSTEKIGVISEIEAMRSRSKIKTSRITYNESDRIIYTETIKVISPIKRDSLALPKNVIAIFPENNKVVIGGVVNVNKNFVLLEVPAIKPKKNDTKIMLEFLLKNNLFSRSYFDIAFPCYENKDYQRIATDIIKRYF